MARSRVHGIDMRLCRLRRRRTRVILKLAYIVCSASDTYPHTHVAVALTSTDIARAVCRTRYLYALRFYQNPINNTCVWPYINVKTTDTPTPRRKRYRVSSLLLPFRIGMRRTIHVRHTIRETRFYCR